MLLVLFGAVVYYFRAAHGRGSTDEVEGGPLIDATPRDKVVELVRDARHGRSASVVPG